MSVAYDNPKNAVSAGRVEHISLEGDFAESRAQPDLRRVLLRYELSERRGATAVVSILHDHYAQTETRRSAERVDAAIVDLRFVDSRPIAIRTVARYSLYVGIAGLVLVAASLALHMVRPEFARAMGGVWTSIGSGAVGLGGLILCFYRTTETLFFLSVHGRAPVIVITGGLGAIRRSHDCAADLIEHINLAHSRFKSSKQAFLRDEMRDHARLRQAGVLSDSQYEEARHCILKAHG